MAVTFGFYNSVNGDRKYDAVQMGRIFDGIIKDGIFDSIGSIFAVSASTGMQILVGTGKGWFNHTWIYNDAALPIIVPQSELLQDRIDTVVIDINATTTTRANSIMLVKGTPSSSNPVRPTLINNGVDRWQYPLCDIFVKRGVTQIISGDITNRIGTTTTPFVTGILESVDITVLLNQWQAQFEDWIRMLEDLLDENVAANLAAAITNHTNTKALSTSGVHGLRWANNRLEYLDNSSVWQPATVAVINNLTSTSTTDPLSAAMGKQLQDQKAPLASPALTGNPTAPTQAVGNNSTRIATTAFVTAGLALRASLDSPAFTGTPTAPTAAPNTNSTQIATTAFVFAGLALKANLASPAFTGVPTAPTAAYNNNTTQIATTAYVRQQIHNQEMELVASVNFAPGGANGNGEVVFYKSGPLVMGYGRFSLTGVAANTQGRWFITNYVNGRIRPIYSYSTVRVPALQQLSSNGYGPQLFFYLHKDGFGLEGTSSYLGFVNIVNQYFTFVYPAVTAGDNPVPPLIGGG